MQQADDAKEDKRLSARRRVELLFDDGTFEGTIRRWEAAHYAALEPRDFILPMHRNLGVFTGRDFDLPRLFRQLLGREGGFTKGRDRTFHFGHLEKGIVGMISHLGAMLPVACGMALAAQLRGHGPRAPHCGVADDAQLHSRTTW